MKSYNDSGYFPVVKKKKKLAKTECAYVLTLFMNLDYETLYM